MKNKKLKAKNKNLIIISILIALVMCLFIVAPISAKIISQPGQSRIILSMPSESELVNGLWYQDINNPIIIGGYQVSFMKIYSGFTGLPNRRVMELSTYPRAYVDTDPHVYTVDTPFTVTEDDLNYYDENGDRWYQDSKGDLYALGSTATHWAGEPLPGAFPMWIESESLPTPSWVDSKSSIFPYVFSAIKGQLVNVVMHEGYYRDSAISTWSKIPQDLFDTYTTAFTSSNTEIKVTKIVKNKDRTISRILYDRIISQ